MSKARELAELGAVYDSGALSNRNLIINGDMQVSQRGDSTSISTQGYYGPDRYSLGINGRDQFVLTISTTSDAPDGYSNAYKIQTTTAETSITDTEYLMVRQVIEARNLQRLAYGTSDAKQLTASFWVKSSVAATYSVFLYQYDGNRNIGSTYTINSANTWEYKTVTFAGDTGGTINDDSGNGMYLAFMLAVGPDMSDTDNTSWGSYTGGRLGFGHSTAANAVVTTTNATWQLTGVQLEVGTEATPFEHKTYSEQLHACRRYYSRRYIGNVGIGWCGGASQWNYSSLPLVPEMRASPTSSYQGGVSGGTWVTATQKGVSTNSSELHSIYHMSSGAANDIYISGSDFYVIADAEL